MDMKTASEIPKRSDRRAQPATGTIPNESI